MKDLIAACFSDIHLAHKANDTLSIIRMLETEIFEKKLLDKIDILFLAGDTFDRLIQLDYPYLPDIDAFAAKLIRECELKNVILRIMEGTPSHDRRQPERFKTIFEIIHSNADFAYVDTLRIEYIAKYDAHVLYIPDEWKADNDETLQEVKALMASKGLEQVDIAVMHGQFSYQMPAHIKGLPIHDAEAYQKLVRTVIFIGHVHTHSRYGKIVAQGSFDRLRHGEEEAKGYVIARIKNNGVTISFIENKAARIYKTIELYDLDITESMSKIETALKGQPMDICLRIEAEIDHPIFVNVGQLEKRFPTVTFSKLPKDRTTGESINLVVHNEFDDWKGITITKENIIDLVMERISTDEFTAPEHSYMRAQLKELT